MLTTMTEWDIFKKAKGMGHIMVVGLRLGVVAVKAEDGVEA